MTTSTKYFYYDFEDAYMKAEPRPDGYTVKFKGGEPYTLSPHTNLAVDILTRGKEITEEEYENA
ncbi:MAG: hypothetical protein KBC16_01315 [Candidatus Pacebacteria bacterium]|nr:hypothetical protein [Candidatus Paceibacterota bacterium]